MSASSTPPVPPRRKKRKAKPAAIAKHPDATSPLKKSSRKRVAPSPPPPSSPRVSRTIKSRVEGDQVEGTMKVNDSEKLRDGPSSCLAIEHTETVEKRNDSPIILDQRFASETMAGKEADKYPSLFFTWHDFQNVVADTLIEEDFSDKASEKFANTFQNSIDEEENLCFRVTTTNLPFEKCLDRWTAFAGHFIEKCDEPSFIFEDYIDRSSKVNIRRSTGSMCYDSSEEEPSVPRLTKVRFVIESPSTSTPDYELNENEEGMCDSLQNIQSLIDEEQEWSGGSTVLLTEIPENEDLGGHVHPDAFGQVPFNSILKATKNSIADENSPEKSLAWRDEKVKVADVSKAELSLLKAKIECNLGLADDKKDSINNLSQADSFASAIHSIHGLQESYENEDNIFVGGEVLFQNVDATGKVDERDLAEQTRVSTDCIMCEVDNSEVSISMEKEESKQVIINEIVKNINLAMPDKVQTEIGNENGIEQAEEDRGKVGTIDKSMQRYKRKLFASEPPSYMINREPSSNNTEEGDDCEVKGSLDSFDIASKSEQIIENVKHNFQTQKSTQPQDSFKSIESFEIKESITAPVNLTRNSFLENMLSEEFWMSCEIVQAHPKLSETRQDTILKDAEKNIGSRTKEPICKILEQSKESLTRVDTSVPNRTAPKKAVYTSGKNAGEAKCEVLNELLSNFSNIKLKPVSGEKKTMDRVQVTYVENEIEPKLEKQLHVCDIQTDDHNVTRETSIVENQRYSSTLDSFQNNRNMNDELSGQEEECQGNMKPCVDEQAAEEQARESSLGEIIKQTLPERSLNSVDCNDAKAEHHLDAEVTDNGYRLNSKPCSLKKRCFASRNFDDYQNQDRGSKLLGQEEKSMNVWSRRRQAREIPKAGSTSDGRKPESRLRNKACKNVADENVSVANPTRALGSIERLQMGSCSEKTDAKDESANPALVQSDDKSAIARISRPHCNNTDNNRAVTPVVVSDDQSRGSVTITPGRVRNFVRYYEIRWEATGEKDSKTSDTVDRDLVPGHRSVQSIRRGLEAKAVAPKSIETVEKGSYSYPSAEGQNDAGNTNKTKVDKLYFIEDDYIEVRKTEVGGKHGMPKRKKSVKFQAGLAATQNASVSQEELRKRLDCQGRQPEGSLESRSLEEAEAAAQTQAAAKCEECSVPSSEFNFAQESIICFRITSFNFVR